MNNVYSIIPDNIKSSQLALATVIETKGSTPQKAGSSALFDSKGLIAGTVGGGVLEGRVQKIAIESIQKKKSGIYHFDLDYDISFKQDAICGGNASVLIDLAPDRNVFEHVKNSLDGRIPGILVTIVKSNDEADVTIDRHWITKPGKNSLPELYSDLLGRDLKELLSSSVPGNFREIELDTGEDERRIRAFLEPLFPLNKLVIAGAGHIGRALAHLGKLLDFEVTVIDDRAEYANKQNIPDADHIVISDIGIALEKLDKKSDTYIVIVTRGHNDDAKALRNCINSGAAYIGMIGSRTKIAQVHRIFIENRWATEDEWSFIHSPVGLSIDSKTVEEIAISIAAELIMVKNSKK
jgi:xanthine dehydrogenase accessory factor